VVHVVPDLRVVDPSVDQGRVRLFHGPEHHLPAPDGGGTPAHPARSPASSRYTSPSPAAVASQLKRAACPIAAFDIERASAGSPSCARTRSASAPGSCPRTTLRLEPSATGCPRPP